MRLREDSAPPEISSVCRCLLICLPHRVEVGTVTTRHEVVSDVLNSYSPLEIGPHAKLRLRT